VKKRKGPFRPPWFLVAEPGFEPRAILGSERLASAKYAAIQKLAKAEKRIAAGQGYKRSNQNRTVFDQSFEARLLSGWRNQFNPDIAAWISAII
jgi:hypothetical protein